MIKFELKNHSIDSYIALAPKKPQLGTLPKEESHMFQAHEYDFDGINNLDATQTEFRTDQMKSHQASGSLVDIQGPSSPTDYIGAFTYDIPININDTFADFTLLNFFENNFNALAGTSVPGSLSEDLFTTDDTDAKIATLFNGSQLLRVPINRFDTILTDQEDIDANDGSEIVENLGKYYIKISPKYIETTITQIDRGKHFKWSELDTKLVGAAFEERRTRALVNPLSFAGTIWDFESASAQRGRLTGSVVEVWTSNGTRLKQPLVLGEHTADPSSAEAALMLYPNLIGYNPPSDVPSVGDIVRIYPRESYFNPIYIEIDYIGLQNDIMSLVRFMKNDVARNLENGIYEIYDDNGVSVDSEGNLSGSVIQSYQISKEGTFEVRRRLNISGSSS